MPRHVIHAESSALTPDDRRKRKLADKLIGAENDRLVDVAKQLATLAFSAIGVVLALREKWLGPSPSALQKTTLAAATAVYLAATVLAMFAAGVYVLRVSLSDYADVDNERHRVATIRYRLCIGALGCIVLATLALSVIALSA
jgi:hypothetical protein